VHLSSAGWISVGLGVIIGFARLGLLAVAAKRKPSGDSLYFNTWMIFGTLVIFLGLPALFWASCRQYFYVYWVLGFLYLALEFFVVYEIIGNALKPYSALIDLGKMLFTWAVLFLGVVAVITALTTVGAHQKKLDAAVVVLERSLRLIECGIVMLFFFFEKRLRLPWRNWNVSLLLGLGITAALDLLGSYVSEKLPAQANAVDCVYSLFFLGVMAFWSYSLSYKAASSKISVMDSPSRLIFQRWNESLSTYGFGGGEFVSDSFLPNVERTVERVMARKMTQ